MLMTEHEKKSLAIIHEWKNPSHSWFEKTMTYINDPLETIFNKVQQVPGVDFVIAKSFGGIFNLINDFAQWSVRPSAICREFNKMGFENIQKPCDVYSLNLEDVDRVIGFLGTKYKTLAAGEGAGCGIIGLPGIPADVVALIALNLRAIGEYATYYGFDISLQEERLFALNVLEYASSPTDTSKQLAMAQLIKISTEVAKKATWKQLEEHVFVRIIRSITKSLEIRLTKAKLADVIPGISVIIGGGFNIYYTSKVCDAAFFLYRERFLAQKYGPEIIEITVPPANDFVTDYGDGNEYESIDIEPMIK